jgi:hypothetical protein
MKALKILGIVFGVVLLLTGTGLVAGSALVSKGQGAFEQELAKSGYAGPVEGTVKSVDQTSPVIVTVTYTDQQGKEQTGQGAASGPTPPNVGDKVSTYYDTSDPSQILVVNVPGLGNLSGVAGTLRTSGIICLVIGGALLLAGILGLVLGRSRRRSRQDRRTRLARRHRHRLAIRCSPILPSSPLASRIHRSRRLASHIHPSSTLRSGSRTSRIHLSSTRPSVSTSRSALSMAKI